MSIRTRKTKDGKTIYQVRRFMGYRIDGKPDQRSRNFTSKRAAELYDAQLLAERDAMRGRSGRITLSAYIDEYYWPVAQKRLAATSLDTYEQEIRLRIRPHLGNIDIRDIDRAKIQRMVDSCATSTVAKKSVGILKTILNHAKGDGLIIANPAEAPFAMPQSGQKRDNGLVLTTFDQIRDLLSIVRQNGSQSVQRVAYTGLLQGLRPEERYALDWCDINTDAHTITIAKAYVASSAKHGGERLKKTKTEKSTRVIPMHPDFIDLVDTLPREDGAFILGANGARISPSTAQKQWRRFLADNPSAKPVTIENMRHSFATSYLHAGGQIADLSLLLGHADINTTLRRYVRPNVDDLRRGMVAISECK